MSENQMPQEAVKELTTRLHRIQGQLRGLEQMVQEGRPCDELLSQMTAALRALKSCASAMALAAMKARCSYNPGEPVDPDDVMSCLEPLLDQLAKL